MTPTENTSTSGIGFTGALTLIFIVLKLLGIITWSWFWVLSPLIAAPLVVIVIVIIAAIHFLYTRLKNK